MQYTLTESQVKVLRDIFAWWSRRTVDLRRGRAARPSAAGSRLVTIKFDGSRGTGSKSRCYTGHLWVNDGTQGAACQFIFDNDPGTDTMPANTLITAEPAPARLADADIWTNTTTKYRGVSCAPYAMLG